MAPHQEVLSLSVTHAPPGGRSTVLIVDDNDDIRLLLRLLLEDDHDVVGEACNGAEALGPAARLKPDFIVLDSEMPVMGGDETAARLRGISPNSRLISFSASVERRPAWAHAILPKDRVEEIASLLSGLQEASSPSLALG
jgi:CheY-like chemotaxis protein